MNIPRWGVVLGICLAVPLAAAAQDNRFRSVLQSFGQHDHGRTHTVSGTLVDTVRKATERYRDFSVAEAEGWAPASPCVSGPSEGAMGVHFVMPSRLDGTLNAEEPELLIYEPTRDGLRLVGVEFITLAADWNALHPNGPTPSLEGHLLNFVGEPNRYGLPSFYELHVWAWQWNPKGSFADWNTLVSCELQTGD